MAITCAPLIFTVKHHYCTGMGWADTNLQGPSVLSRKTALKARTSGPEPASTYTNTPIIPKPFAIFSEETMAVPLPLSGQGREWTNLVSDAPPITWAKIVIGGGSREPECRAGLCSINPQAGAERWAGGSSSAPYYCKRKGGKRQREKGEKVRTLQNGRKSLILHNASPARL